MQVEFVGAVGGNVTGSRHIVHTEKARILLDCGLFQGRRSETIERNRHLGFRAQDIDVMVLSHAHIDHSGALPRLYRLGFRGPIYCTPATRDLCAAMLEDSAEIQAQDAAYINRKIEKNGVDMKPVEPLYEQKDVVGTLELMVGVPYHRRQQIAEGVNLTYYDAGHVLGSAMVALDVDVVGEALELLGVQAARVGSQGRSMVVRPECQVAGCCLDARSVARYPLLPEGEGAMRVRARLVVSHFPRNRCNLGPPALRLRGDPGPLPAKGARRWATPSTTSGSTTGGRSSTCRGSWISSPSSARSTGSSSVA